VLRLGDALPEDDKGIEGKASVRNTLLIDGEDVGSFCLLRGWPVDTVGVYNPKVEQWRKT